MDFINQNSKNIKIYLNVVFINVPKVIPINKNITE